VRAIGIEPANLCHVRTHQGISVTSRNGRTHALTVDDAAHRYSAIRCVSWQTASHAHPGLFFFRIRRAPQYLRWQGYESTPERRHRRFQDTEERRHFALTEPVSDQQASAICDHGESVAGGVERHRKGPAALPS